MIKDNRVIVRGKRHCVFMRNGNEFHLIVTYDESWQVKPISNKKNKYIFAFSLSPSAALLWEMLKDCPDKQTLLLRISDKFDLSSRIAERILSNFLKTLYDYSLIEYAPSLEDVGQSPYELVSGSNGIVTDDVVFDSKDIIIRPIELEQDVFCQPSDPTWGYLKQCMCA